MDEYIPPDGVEEEMKLASKNHITSNKHHPEYWVDGDIDEMGNPLDASGMSNDAIAEMVADWCAMSEELGKNTPKEWADDNVGTKWEFTEEQKKLIYELIESVWIDDV